MTIAIAAATGLTGSICLQQMLANPQMNKVIAIGGRGTGLQHPKLQEVLLQNNQLPQNINADALSVG